MSFFSPNNYHSRSEFDNILNNHCHTANDRSALNLERRLDHEGHPLAITAAEAVGASGASPWNWRETPGSG